MKNHWLALPFAFLHLLARVCRTLWVLYSGYFVKPLHLVLFHKGKTQLAFSLARLAGERLKYINFACFSGEEDQAVYISWQDSMTQLKAALQSDLADCIDNLVLSVAETRVMEWPKTIAWLSHLLERKPDRYDVESLKACLPAKNKPIIVLDEFSSKRTVDSKHNGSRSECQYLMRENLALVVRQILRSLKLPFIAMGTNAAAANVVMPPKSSTSGDTAPPTFVVVTCAIDESPPESQKEAISTAVQVLVEKSLASTTKNNREISIHVLVDMIQKAKPLLRRTILLELKKEAHAEVENFGALLDCLRLRRAFEFFSKIDPRKLYCRSAFILMQLHCSRANSVLPEKWFDDDQADLCSSLDCGSTDRLRFCELIRAQDRSRGILVSDQKEWVRYARYRSLEDDLFFHFLRCGSERGSFCDQQGRPVPLLSSLGELWDNETGQPSLGELFKNEKVKGSDGTTIEVFLCLGVIAASHSKGFTRAPEVHEFLEAALREWTATKYTLQDSQDLKDAFPGCTIPFASPSNTPWPASLAQKFFELGIVLGDTSRPVNQNGIDLLLKPFIPKDDSVGNAIHISGEAKDREVPVNGALMSHMLDRVPETYEVGLHIIVTVKSTTAFRPETKNALGRKAKKKGVLVLTVSCVHGEFKLKRLLEDACKRSPRKIVILICLSGLIPLNEEKLLKPLSKLFPNAAGTALSENCFVLSLVLSSSLTYRENNLKHRKQG